MGHGLGNRTGKVAPALLMLPEREGMDSVL